MPLDRKINYGGLFRCCVDSIDKLPDDTPETEGHIVKCLHCHEDIVCRDGVWQWPGLKKVSTPGPRVQ